MKKEKKIIDLNRKRAKQIFLKLFRILRIPLAAVFVIAVIVITAMLMGKTAVSNAADAFRAVPAVFSQSLSFPYSEDSLSLRRADLIGNDILILTADHSKVISSAPRERFTCQLESADSRADTRNGRALIFSNTSGTVVLQSKTEKLGSVTVDGTVKTACLSGSGSFALTYASDEAQSVAEVYDGHFEKVFGWNCSKEFISALSLSDNGKRLVIGAVGTENAGIYSRLIIFGVNESEPDADIRIDGTLLLKIITTSSGRIIAIGDNLTRVYSKDGEQLDEITYAENSLTAADSDDGGNTVICYKTYGGAKSEIVRFSASGKRTCSFCPEAETECLSVKGNRFAVSSGNAVTVYSSGGEVIKTVDIESTPKQILLSSNHIFTVEGDSIYEY